LVSLIEVRSSVEPGRLKSNFFQMGMKQTEQYIEETPDTK